MKKYITLAALLAAGTAYANAEESTLPLLSLEMISSWETIALTSPSGAHTAGNSGFTWAGGENLEESWKLSFDWSVSSTALDRTGPFELFGTNGQNAAYGIVIQYKDGGLYIVDRDYNNGIPTTATICHIDNVDLSSTAQKVTIAYLESNDAEKYSSTFVLQVGNEIAYGESPSDGTVFVNNGVTRIWANGNPNGKDLFSNITLSSASAVPEPSAFGMIAGLGALALVASRRRRK